MTKSRKTTVRILLIVLALLALATTLVACNIGNGPAHYDYLVTFNYNLGDLKANAPNQQVGLLGENPLVQIWPGFTNSENTLEEYAVNSYYIEGWYLPELNEDGTLKKDDKGFVLLDEKWDFEYDRVDENITLYANLQKKPCIRFADKASGEYIEGATGKIELVPGDYYFKPSDSAAPTVSEKTFLGKYYVSRDSDKEFVWDRQIGTEDITVYVSFIDGIWVFVNTERDFLNQIRANKNIYLEKDLDFSKFSKTQLGNPTNYSGKIEGNNHKVKNITRDLTASRLNADGFGGIFKTLGATAEIRNITFENVNVTFAVNSTYTGVDAYVGALAYSAEEGAKFVNVTVTGKVSYKPNDNKEIHAGVIGIDKTTGGGIDHSGVTVEETTTNN